MSSRFPERGAAFRLLVLVLELQACGAAAADASTSAEGPLRVCADPDNLPYSHHLETGFENRIARLVAEDLGRPLQYFWQPQHRGFVRKNIGEGHCDVFIGVPADFSRVLTTKPYYRSSYVFAFRSDDPEP